MCDADPVSGQTYPQPAPDEPGEPDGLRRAARQAVEWAQRGEWTPTEIDLDIGERILLSLWWDADPSGLSVQDVQQLFSEALAEDLSEPMAHLLREASEWEPARQTSGPGSWGAALAELVASNP